jgi:hypothetical protein
MRALRLFIVVALLMAAQAFAGSFYTGNELAEWMREYERFERGDTGGDLAAARSYMTFVAGVHDTADGIVVCSPVTTTVGQVSAITTKFMRANPERWNSPANVLVLEALATAFPCQATKGAKRKGASL